MKIFSPGVLLLLAFLSVTISGQRNFSPVSLVPEKSIAVLRVNWSQVRANEKLKQIVSGESFAQLANQTGVSENKITEWVVFSDINPTSARGMGIIMAGSFTAQSVVAFAKSKDWKAEKIGTNTAFLNPADNSYLMPLRNGLLAAGTKTGMEKVQGVMVKPRASILGKEPFSAVWTQIGGGRQPISFYAGIPPEYQKVADIGFKIATKLMDLASFGLMGTIFEAIGLVRSTGFTVSYKKDAFPTELVAIMDSETKAWVASGALNLLKKAPSAVNLQARTAEEEAMLKSLQTMSASYKKEVLSVKFEMPESAMVKP